MKKVITLGIVSAILFALTGCVRVETSYKINKDDSGYNSIMVSYNEPVTKELGFNPQSIMKEVYNVTNGLDMIKDSEYYTSEVGYLHDDMKFVGENRLLYFDNITKIFKQGASQGNTIGYIENSYGMSRIELSFKDMKVPSEHNSILDKLFYEAGGEILFSIEVENPVINHNATRIEGKKYIWDLMDVAKNPEKYGDAAFIEYRSGRKQPVVSRSLISRRSVRNREEIEGILDLNIKDIDFQALSLEKLGLLTGTNKGLELNRKVTRIEGIVFYSKLLGVEHEIQKFKTLNPGYSTGFTDIPKWAEDTVNYLHYMKLISGISKDKFGSNQEMSENQFVTLILRALGYSEANGDFNYKTAHVTANELGFYKDDHMPYNIINQSGFTRRLMSYIGYNSLFVENKTTGVRLLDNHIK